jgi:hypothetical protein
MEPIRVIIKAFVRQRNGILTIIWAVVGIMSFSVHGVAIGAGKEGVARGETSQQLGQQGLGIEGEVSSPILAGPETIIGSIKKIRGEEYTIEGDRGQSVRIRVTTDTNKVCPSGDQAKVSSGQEGVQEHAEVPPTPSMQQQAREKKRHSQRADKSDQQDLQQYATAPPSRDPSQRKGTTGSTDPRANEDVARGSGFLVGQCAFKEGDHVRIEASDMGTATTIKQLLSSRSGH